MSRAAVPGRASHRAFLGVSALVFAASAVLTVAWCGSMAAMHGMAMPGGWTMSMTWMLMPGQAWVGAAAAFLGVWVVMMVAMMLPSLVPMLKRYREAVVQTGSPRLGRLTAIAGAGYFFVWTLFGVAVFPLGLALASAAMEHPGLARAVPLAAGVAVLLAGLLQFTPWKTRHLACCRESPAPGHAVASTAGAAWRHGLFLGLQCCACCLGLMTVLLVAGVMDLRVMALVAIAIAVERMAPSGRRAAQLVGVIVAGAGFVLITRAL